MAKRERFDLKRPDARQITDSIVHGAFITEGTMVAFPTCRCNSTSGCGPVSATGVVIIARPPAESSIRTASSIFGVAAPIWLNCSR